MTPITSTKTTDRDIMDLLGLLYHQALVEISEWAAEVNVVIEKDDGEN